MHPPLVACSSACKVVACFATPPARAVQRQSSRYGGVYIPRLRAVGAGERPPDSSDAGGGSGRSFRWSAVRAAAVQETVSALLVEEEEKQENGAHISEERVQSPGDYIGYGSLLEDKSFRERFVVRFGEVGIHGRTSLETLSALLQEAATNHVIWMDYGFSPGRNMSENITVTTRMHIEVDRYPVWRDLLEIDTWFQAEGKNAVRRDWTVRDVKTGQHIAFATSVWVLMNPRTRRLSKISQEMWTELEPHMRKPFKWALSEDRRQNSSRKIEKLDDEAALKTDGLIASEKDCDMNQHVNNVRYLSWMLESIPEELKRSYEVSKITLEYRQEALPGQSIHSIAHPEEAEGSSRQFTHLIRSSGDGKEINRGRTVWRPLLP